MHIVQTLPLTTPVLVGYTYISTSDVDCGCNSKTVFMLIYSTVKFK